MVPPGQIPQNMMPQPEPQPVDPTLLKKIEQYEKLIEKYPENTDLHYNLGNLKYLAGNHEEAINDYRKNLSTLDEKKKSHALYNIGNSYFSQGKYQESADFYKKAMQSNPNDEDMKINYELTRRMLQQQQQQQQSQQSDNDKNEDKEEQQQEQQEQEKQQSENQDGEKKESGEEQEAQENQQEPEQKPGDEESQKEEQQRLKEMSEEKQLAKEEAEAILNALKASQENLMKKKYVVKNRQKLEKDW